MKMLRKQMSRETGHSSQGTLNDAVVLSEQRQRLTLGGAVRMPAQIKDFSS